MLLLMENLDQMMLWCHVSNVDPNYFFGKLQNHNWCKKTGLILHGWCVDVVLKFLIQ